MLQIPGIVVRACHSQEGKVYPWCDLYVIMKEEGWKGTACS